MHIGPVPPGLWPTAFAVLVAAFLLAWSWWDAQQQPPADRWTNDDAQDECDDDA